MLKLLVPLAVLASFLSMNGVSAQTADGQKDAQNLEVVLPVREPASRPLTLTDRNLAFLADHEKRLLGDIKKLENEQEAIPKEGKNWLAGARAGIIAEKTEHLALVRHAREIYSDQNNRVERPFENLKEVQKFVGGEALTAKKADIGRNPSYVIQENPALLLESADKFFDETEYSEQASFLKKLGISKTGKDEDSLDEKDLSPLFYEPQSGGDASQSPAHCIVSDFETNAGVPALSYNFAYGIILASSQFEEGSFPADLEKALKIELGAKTEKGLQKKLKRVEVQLEDIFGAVGRALIPTEKDFPAPKIFLNGKAASGIPRFAAEDHAEFVVADNQDLNFNFLKRLIGANKPVIVFLKSRARAYDEDWLKITAEAGQGASAVNIVGYGLAGKDPFDSKEKPYLIVRDSMGPKHFHYKVSAADLLESTLAIMKTTGVRRIASLEVSASKVRPRSFNKLIGLFEAAH